MGGGGELYKKIVTFYLADFESVNKYSDDLLHIFATVMPHSVIEYIQDELEVKLCFFSENMNPPLDS